MRTGRSLAVIALAAAALVVGSNKAGAQAQPPAPPDLRMLLNLDLFRPQPSDAGNGAPEQRSNASMLDQIRALKAMGYLRANSQANSQANPETNSDDTTSAPGASDAGGARTTTPGPPPDDFGGQR
jgi:hypothetical protein